MAFPPKAGGPPMQGLQGAAPEPPPPMPSQTADPISILQQALMLQQGIMKGAASPDSQQQLMDLLQEALMAVSSGPSTGPLPGPQAPSGL